MKDYEPLTFTASEDLWGHIARNMPDLIKSSIYRKMSFGNTHLQIFQSDMEKIMWWLNERKMWGTKNHFQNQIDKYIKSGEWV